MLVYSETDCDVGIYRRSSNNDFLCSTLNVFFRTKSVCKMTRAFNNKINSEIIPWKIQWIFFEKHLNLFVTNFDHFMLCGDFDVAGMRAVIGELRLDIFAQP